MTSPNIFKQNLTIFITKVTQFLNSTEDGTRGFYNEAQNPIREYRGESW